ncbi:MAG: DNA alkylation repair protein [Thiomicrorhabdus sp.]|nr:DNA alkylation repair protein [Thiomicrorhabdus sp.]
MTDLLKEEIDLKTIKKMAVLLKLQHAGFNAENFVAACMTANWEELALKKRIRQVAQTLHDQLALPYSEAIDVLKPVSNEFNGLFHFIFSDYVELYGLEDFQTSMQALELFTQNSTAEFAIRPFLQKQPEQTKQQMLLWSMSDKHHLRRLASEGVRPKLPWAKHLPWIGENPEWVRPILQNLKDDDSRYVQKSVANLLNDLSKTQPDWVLDICREWSFHVTKATLWIIKHGLRTLLKQGNSEALRLLGYGAVNSIRLNRWQLADRVIIGDKLQGEFVLISEKALGKLRVEYALYFLRKQHAPYRKVFKIAESDDLLKCKTFRLTHNFKRITTRKYIPGLHKIELIVNGQVLKSAQFELHN